MSQVDKVHYLPTLVWVIIIFIIWYVLVLVWIIPMYYKSLRSRVMYEKALWNNVIEYIYLLNVVKIFKKLLIKDIDKSKVFLDSYP